MERRRSRYIRCYFCRISRKLLDHYAGEGKLIEDPWSRVSRNSGRSEIGSHLNREERQEVAGYSGGMLEYGVFGTRWRVGTDLRRL